MAKANIARIDHIEVKKNERFSNPDLYRKIFLSMGATLYTKNKEDFLAIQDIFHFKVMFV